jgi:hypothetical protein
VRCSETTAAVYAADRSRARLVQQIPGDCLGYGTSFQGLASDGRSFFYSLLSTRPKPVSSRCGEGGACRWQLAGGRILRLAGAKAAAVRGLPPAVLIAGASGRLALVEPARSATSKPRGPFDWPRAAANGSVQIRDAATASLVTSFRPRGTVRAVALSAYRAIVLVQLGEDLRIEWYDADTGARLGAASVPRSTARRVSTDGRFVAYAGRRTVSVLDLETGTQRLVASTSGEPVGPSVRAGRVVWGENGRVAGRIRSAPAAGGSSS